MWCHACSHRGLAITNRILTRQYAGLPFREELIALLGKERIDRPRAERIVDSLDGVINEAYHLHKHHTYDYLSINIESWEMHGDDSLWKIMKRYFNVPDDNSP